MSKSKKDFKIKKRDLNKDFQKRVLDIFSQLKIGKHYQPLPYKLPIYNEREELIAILRPLNIKTLQNNMEISLLSKWRKENSFAFPSQFKVTLKGTKIWLEKQFIYNPSRILFFIEDTAKKPKLVGHLGLYSFDFQACTCEVDNVVRGEKNYMKGIMTLALKALLKWTCNELKPKQIFLRVFSDNDRAVNYYKRCGFVNYELIPLRKIAKPNMIIWEEDNTLENADKYFLKMILKRY